MNVTHFLYGVAITVIPAIVYLIPTFIAHLRDVHEKAAITVLNIVFGWTVVVWVIVFIMALMGSPVNRSK